MPTANDTERTCRALADAGLSGAVCRDLASLCREIQLGAGAALLTEEAIVGDRQGLLTQLLQAQPAWSDFPFVILAGQGSAGASRQESMNAMLVDQPASPRTLLSVVRGAIRSRRQQYAIRDHLAERGKQANALVEVEERLRRIVNVDGVGVLLWALPQGRLIDANDFFLRMFGYSRADLKATVLTWRDLTPPEYVAISEEQLKGFAETGRIGPYEKEYLRKDGTRAWMVFAGATLDADTIVEYCIDISDRKHAEESHRQSEERYRTLFEKIDQGFCAAEVIFEGGVASDYRILEVNPAFQKQTRLTNVAGKTIRELVPDQNPLWLDAFEKVAKTGQSARFINEAKALGDRWFEVYAFPLGQKNRVAILFSDITDRLRTERDRERLVSQLREADRKKDDFIALLAHELRNPLAPIRNGLQVLRLAASDAGAVMQARMLMERQLSHMVRLIDDLLDVSRISRNKMELRRNKILLADVIASAVETASPLIEAAGLQLVVSLPPVPVFIDADLTRLAQVFSNLLTNSAKYTERGGRIELSSTCGDAEISVTIRDSGIGIPAHALPTIFEMFSQVDRSVERSSGGLGIGLALVRGLVELHGGTVSAESPGEGKGSSFKVVLPNTNTGTLRNESASPEKGSDAVGRKVLIVDDNEDAATSMAMMLRLLGDEVRTAHDGLAAIESAERFQPHVILMDVGMPRLNGLDATRRIREKAWGKEMTIIALTGWGQESDLERSRLAGCNGHLVKPVSLPDLESLLAEQLSKWGRF